MIIAKFFPNGEFSQGVDTSKSRKPPKVLPCPLPGYFDDMGIWNAEVRSLPIRIEEYREISSKYDLSQWCLPGFRFGSKSGFEYEVISHDWRGTELEWTDKSGKVYRGYTIVPMYQWACNPSIFPLVYPSVESSDTPSRKKLEKMTKPMARNIRNACYLLEQDVGKDRLSFLTLTLPNLSTEELGLCCSRWDRMVGQFLDWLAVTIKRKGGAFQYIYCTEIQTKRLQSGGGYAPHLHLIYQGRGNGKKTSWYVTPKKCRSAWTKCIVSVVGHSKFDNRALENLQRVKYSAGGYLSKYLSKGGCLDGEAADKSGVTLLRTQWGGMSRSLSRSIRSATQRLSTDSTPDGFMRWLLCSYQYLCDIGVLKYYKISLIDLSPHGFKGARFLKGCTGCLSVPTFVGGLLDVFERFYYQELYQST
jgi:hypothetical protein